MKPYVTSCTIVALFIPVCISSPEKKNPMHNTLLVTSLDLLSWIRILSNYSHDFQKWELKKLKSYDVWLHTGITPYTHRQMDGMLRVKRILQLQFYDKWSYCAINKTSTFRYWWPRDFAVKLSCEYLALNGAWFTVTAKALWFPIEANSYVQCRKWSISIGRQWTLIMAVFAP